MMKMKLVNILISQEKKTYDMFYIWIHLVEFLFLFFMRREEK